MFDGRFQPMHLLLILVVALVVFAPKQLPEIAKALGEAIRGFKNTLNQATSESVKPSDNKQDQPKGHRLNDGLRAVELFVQHDLHACCQMLGQADFGT